tara:strand:- start:968 stop:1216 length:249 start_codon:yes stop_codon:yes gene_type:complete
LPGTKSQTPFFFDGEPLDKCPLTYNNIGITLSLSLYNAYKNGFLPENGGWLEQSHVYTETMLLIDNDQKQFEANEIEKANKK